ncbi:hypothetical protein KEG38_23830 [Polyangium jinanense]|uniref:PEP/pyruvate-binding domain-containing protein n=1 Tax=Polyangium jinanense TaxID=2829994 RepID=UPI0023400EC0|nr:PEP/pyruvate-binding domain-containing protein [Polyangium jinanense]MDC3956911.1 hypothetical protein [Polyangium jinanense]
MTAYVELGAGSVSERVGGKAAGLFRLRSLGVAVPDGFVVLAGEEPSEAEIANALRALVARSGCVTVAVRSSGALEDGGARSLAGLFESELDVEATAARVLEAIARCRSSGRSTRAEAAKAAERLPAVIVQQMIHPQWSGLLFTKDPRDGIGAAVIELVQGHLRNLVDGAAPELRVSLDEQGRRAVAARLGVDALDALDRLARCAEQAVGGPADVEWALVDHDVIALQARPITGLRGTRGEPGIELVPVDRAHAARLPEAVRRHDKVTLRLLAEELDIPISRGFVAVCQKPEAQHVAAVAEALRSWGEFIAVLLAPFRWQDKIVRKFGEGNAAEACIRALIDELAGHDAWFAFLVKELQPTARTGIAVRREEGDVVVEIVHGHFISKGIADATTYRIGPGGVVRSVRLGKQATQAVVEHGNVREEPVDEPPELSPAERKQIFDIVQRLATHHPRAGIEFGYTPAGKFFLVDLYEGNAVAPRSPRDDVICEGRVVGRVQFVDHDPRAVRESIERHIHNTRSSASGGAGEPLILVARRPFHVLDEIVYAAPPGTLGMVFEEGSLLCHLAVVMREHGVPGFILPNVRQEVSDGDRVVLDVTPGLAPTLRKL